MNIQNLVRENIKNLTPYSSARDEFSADAGVFLDANENPFGDYNRYPDPYQKALKAEISKLKNIEANKIFLGNGSDEVIDLLMRIFAEPKKDKILVFNPTYGMYEVSANINDVEVVSYPLNQDFQIEFSEELEKILKDENPTTIFMNLQLFSCFFHPAIEISIEISRDFIEIPIEISMKGVENVR